MAIKIASAGDRRSVSIFMDFQDKAATRSRTMSACRSRDTRPERILRSYLHALGFRYRLYVKSLPGTPDIVLPRYRTVIFVDGCFWHGHVPCRSYLPPISHRKYWIPKIAINKNRDRRQSADLRKAGWKVIRVRECELRNAAVLEARLFSLLSVKHPERCAIQLVIRFLQATSVLIASFLDSLQLQAKRSIK